LDFFAPISLYAASKSPSRFSDPPLLSYNGTKEIKKRRKPVTYHTWHDDGKGIVHHPLTQYLLIDFINRRSLLPIMTRGEGDAWPPDRDEV